MSPEALAKGDWQATVEAKRTGLNTMFYVYIIRSQSFPAERYIGRTDNPRQRLAEHNSGKSPHTSKFRPWKCETLIGFDNEEKAVAFEKYLKSGSGFAFAKKHF